MRAEQKRTAIFSLALIGLVFSTSIRADDDALKKRDQETPRYPNYTYESEVPHEKLMVPGASSGMFFGRHEFGDMFMGRWRADYENYGWKDYENYRLNTTPYLRTYDTFGNYIADGYEVFSLQEVRTQAPLTGSILRKGRFYQNWLRHIVIADDSYGGWTNRLIVGDFIHTTFTPLTLDMANFNGVRFDAMSVRGESLTLLASRISDPIKISPTDDFVGRGKSLSVNDGVYLVGAHLERDVGGMLLMGASYVNLMRFDSQRGVSANGRNGLAPSNTIPQQIIVRFEDDSPEDSRSGAAVFDVSARLTLAPAIDAEGEEETVVDLEPVAIETSMEGVVVASRHMEAIGVFRDASGVDSPAYIDYVFDLPEEARGLRISALVANDYKISLRQKHFFVTNFERGSGERRETPFATVRRAEHNIVDMSNKRTVSFDYGLSTGVEVMGINARLAIPGWDVHGEFAKSRNSFQYPSRAGARDKFTDVAGYLTVRRDWPLLSVGGEWFSVGPKYTTYNPHPSERGGQLGESFFFNEARQNYYRNGDSITRNPSYSLVDDNDNMLYSETPDNWLVQGDPRELDTPNREASGIFPSFDLDQDGHADTNRNRNEFADYDEPFLMYFSDPPEMYFGDDFNNNGITDAWEDDDLPNYPYYKDEQGIHLRSTLRPLPGVNLTIGRYAIDQIADAGQNDVFYGVLKAQRHYGNWRFSLDHESKDVRDSIANDYFKFLLREGVSGASYTRVFFEDALDTRDSFVNRGLVKVEYSLGRWSAEGKVRYELNHQRRRQFGDGLSQEDDDLTFIGTVFRTEYTHRIGRLSLKPRFKLLYRMRERESRDERIVNSMQFLPILRADYRLTERSQLRFGLQGFPLLNDRRADYVDRANDRDQTTWTLMWFGQSEYEGFKIGTEIGVMREKIDFDSPQKPDAEFNRFFVRMISAVGSVVR